ncbi:winged helix-turn-helix domain-containing protein [Mycoplasma sp. ATU-Cv-703]|uniref:winged helix-turn-helix domain-containing protein n=1 Tax=Mycoplasma sp. ATU-Cv-703 TaxID=2498595 RepID=UPI000FDE2135
MSSASLSKLKIVSLIRSELTKDWHQVANAWEKYFNVDHTVDRPDQLASYLNQHVDFLFLDGGAISGFELNYKDAFKKVNQSFSYVVLKDAPDHQDTQVFKLLADDIIHLSHGFEQVKWKTIALLRRYWEIYSKPTTVIYRGIIADFIDSYVSLNGNEISLTRKEFLVLKLLLERRRQHVSKSEIFNQVWKYVRGGDTTRVVDQIIFKLRKKIGSSYFHTDRERAIKFE